MLLAKINNRACALETGRSTRLSLFCALGFLGVLALTGLPCLPAGAQREKTLDFPSKPQSRQILSIPDSCHTQGIAFDDDFFYLSCAAKKDKKAWVYRIARPDLGKGGKDSPVSFEKIDVTEGAQYHPSGLDTNGLCLWVAVADYHPAPAASTFKCINRRYFEEDRGMEFKFNDHIGTIACSRKWMLAINWDAKIFYLVDYSGKSFTKGVNRSGASYQDCKHFREDLFICAGPAGKISGTGYLDLLEISDEPKAWSMKQRAVVSKTGRKLLTAANEGMAFEGTIFYFVPDDLPNAVLYRFAFPQFFE